MFDDNNLSLTITDGLEAIYQQARSSLLIIHNGRRFAGAGVLWRPEGIIVTNNHVIQRGRPNISLLDGGQFEARLVARAKEFDLAILQITADWEPEIVLKAASIADSRRVRVGQIVLAIGHPWGQVGAVSMGIVSNLGSIKLTRRRGTIQVIHTDVHLAPGNSGGPLLNARGEVIGINTMIQGGDLGIAVPSHVVSHFVAQNLGQEIFQEVI